MESFNAQNAEMNKAKRGMSFLAPDLGEFAFLDKRTLLLDFPTLAMERNEAMVAFRLAVLNETIGAFPREIPRLLLDFFNIDDDLMINPASFFRESVLEILIAHMQTGLCFKEIDMGKLNSYDVSAHVMAKFMRAAAYSGTEVFRARGMMDVLDADEAEQIRGGIHALLSTVRAFYFGVEVSSDSIDCDSRGELWASAVRANPRLEILAIADALVEDIQDVRGQMVVVAGECPTLTTLHLYDQDKQIPPTVVRALRATLSSNPSLRTVVLDGLTSVDTCKCEECRPSRIPTEFVWKAEDLENARGLVQMFHGLSLYLNGERLGGRLSTMARALQGEAQKSRQIPRLPQATVFALSCIMQEHSHPLSDPEFPTLSFFFE